MQNTNEKQALCTVYQRRLRFTTELRCRLYSAPSLLSECGHYGANGLIRTVLPPSTVPSWRGEAWVCNTMSFQALTPL